MPTWLQSIQAALEMVTGEDAVEPNAEACKHDHVVGVADQELRKLFYLFLQNKKKSQEAAAAVLLLSGKDREAKLQEATKFDSQADVLKDMFWVSCRYAFPELSAKPAIGIRKGWKVVWTEYEHHGLEVLGALMSESVLESLLRDGSDDQPGEATGSKSSRSH